MSDNQQSQWEDKTRVNARKIREDYEADPKTCPTCEKVLPYEKRRNKFCSKSCAASHNNKGKVRVKTVNPVGCAHCGAVKETRANKYCDACIAEGVYNKPQSLEELVSPEGVRAWLLRTREHRCEDCGLSEWKDMPITLEVHHVDGDSDHNTEENLQLLCPNCHSYTDNFKAGARVTGEKGRFSKRRVKRRKRYADGKSW